MNQRALRMVLTASTLAGLSALAGCSKPLCSMAMSDGAAPPRGSAEGPTATPGAPGAASATRAIEEADIIQVDGDRLYAMSGRMGLSVIDLTVPSRLSLLGRAPVTGKPFEMYRRGDVVFAMSNEAVGLDGRDAPPAQGAPTGAPSGGIAAPSTLPYSARITAFDVTDPHAMKTIAAFDVPGEIADSRAVGDVVYVVSFENGRCFKCAGEARTVITSFDLSQPTAIRKIDQISFQSELDDTTFPAWRRSVATGKDRLFVSGFERARGSLGSYRYDSHVDVLDVSDPSGKIGVGVRIAVKGEILSRWQMDEHDGVLRVVSQYGLTQTRNGEGYPLVTTFALDGARAASKRAEAQIVLHQQEALKSVRFDGARAYAITFRETDPLFTLDLADPDAPRVAGELKIPGFVHHIEPRGDRLIGLGVDQSAERGALNVSLFDVSDLSQPRMLDRVSFGAYNGLRDLTEDQNRIHKAFRVFDDQGLVAIPYTSRYVYAYGDPSCQPNQSGVQLVRFSRDALSLDALLELPGTPRRALVHRKALVAVSDTNVRSFSLADTTTSRPLSDLALGECSAKPSFNEGGYYGNDNMPMGGWDGSVCE